MDFTNQLAPGPMWQPTQAVLACAPRWKAVCSGCMTLWQVSPQNWVDSIVSTPL